MPEHTFRGADRCRDDSSSGFQWTRLEETQWSEKIEAIDKRMIEELV